MRGISILGALESKMQTVPMHTRLARETGAGRLYAETASLYALARVPDDIQRVAIAVEKDR